MTHSHEAPVWDTVPITVVGAQTYVVGTGTKGPITVETATKSGDP
jgi:hypothetical protein